MNNNQTYIIRTFWSGISLEIEHTPLWSRAHEAIYGYSLSHLAVKSVNPDKEPLPITETGYRSIFLPSHIIEENGGAEKYIHSILNQEAMKPEWIARDQLALF